MSKAADEITYQQNLKRQGTPEERERMGVTITGATGTWLGDAAFEVDKKQGKVDAKVAQLASVVSSWETIGVKIDEYHCKFK